MLRELVHFFSHAPAMLKLQKQYGKAEFCDYITTRVDEQGYADVRRDVARGLRGRILEVGCGTGAMFGYYEQGVDVEAIEPDPDFRRIAERKAADHPHVRVSDGDAMHLAFPDGAFDGAVVCLVLCSVPSIDTVLTEIHRVLKPGGLLRVLEHVRSHARFSGLLMDLANPLWLNVNKQGCNLNRRPAPAIEAAGFEVEELQEFQRFDTLLPAFPMQRINARRRA